MITNDLDTGTADIYEQALSADRIVMLQPGQALADIVAPLQGTPVVIDFGGFVESRVIEAATLADITVVPLAYQSTADLLPAIKTVTAIASYCKSIILLINNTAPEHVPDLKALLHKRFPEVPILVVNRSRYISRLADLGLTVSEIAKLEAIARHQLRHVLPQIQILYAALDAAVTS